MIYTNPDLRKLQIDPDGQRAHEQRERMSENIKRESAAMPKKKFIRGSKLCKLIEYSTQEFAIANDREFIFEVCKNKKEGCSINNCGVCKKGKII